MTPESKRQPARSSSRRTFLGSLGLGAAGIVAASVPGVGVVNAKEPEREGGGSGRGDRFGRMFRLPPFADATPAVIAALTDMGRPGGLLDAHDDLAAGPVLLITDLHLSLNNPNNTTHTAGTTFMGQFMDHDMTFDIGSPLGVPTRPESSANGRTPAFDLDSVYGGGPTVSAYLYQTADLAKLNIGFGGRFEDLPRTTDKRAIIAEGRNDEHVILAGLHAAFILFHNRAVDHVRAGGARPKGVFEKARELTVWHYQWMILHEFLPLFVGQPMVDDILQRGRRYYRPDGDAFMPVEFQGAAYRFGHSMVRPSYRANFTGNPGNTPFFGLIFDPAEEGKPDPNDLRGGALASRRFVDWQTFYDFGDANVKPNKKIDTKLSSPLFNLPLGAIASHDGPTSLPVRTLLRGLTWSLPSGQAIARRIGAPVLGRSDFTELAHYNVGFDENTPLFYYILKEAQMLAAGEHLGPVGGRIVGEVIIGLLQTDPAGYLSQNPQWTPSLPKRGSSFKMIDFLTFARVDPLSRATP